jgi:hypothetical protein
MPKTEKLSTVEMSVDVIQSPNKQVIPVAGIFGGINSQGLLMAHLYIEYSDMPGTGKVKIDLATKKVEENSLDFRADHLTREVVATIAIPSALVPAFKEWFEVQSKAAAAIQTIKLT